MAYADQQMSGNRIVAIIIVALIHVALGYALITGLAYNAVQQVVERVTTIDIEEPPPPEEEPPPPPENVPDTPPPPVAPPPPINIAPASDPDADDDPAAGTAAAGHSAAGTSGSAAPAVQGPQRFAAWSGWLGPSDPEQLPPSRRARRYRG